MHTMYCLKRPSIFACFTSQRGIDFNFISVSLLLSISKSLSLYLSLYLTLSFFFFSTVLTICLPISRILLSEALLIDCKWNWLSAAPRSVSRIFTSGTDSIFRDFFRHASGWIRILISVLDPPAAELNNHSCVIKTSGVNKFSFCSIKHGGL